MATAEITLTAGITDITEITLTPLTKKQKRESSPFWNPEESLDVIFGKKGRYQLTIDADGKISLYDDQIDSEEVFSRLKIKDLIKIYLASQTEPADALPSVNNESTFNTSPAGTATAF